MKNQSKKICFPLLLIFFASIYAYAQKEKLPKFSAGFPINYEEDSVGNYTLPHLLTMADGSPIKTTKEWETKRRPELVGLLENIQFGKMPPPPARLRYQVFDNSPAMDGKATRRQVRIYLTDDTTHKMDLLIYLPNATGQKKVPVILTVSFVANNQAVEDAAVRTGYTWTRDGKLKQADSASSFRPMNVAQFIDAGIGFATVYYGDIEPDCKGCLPKGIRGKYLAPGQTDIAPNEWGAISAWAWGLGRAMDYFEKDPDIDHNRVALQGASRLGKTVLWTGVKDTRFKLVIASISGEGGAALTRRNYGENIRHITDTSRYFYQFAPAYHSHADKTNALPFDAHSLVACMAPRPLLLQTGDTDYWSDPKGEFLSALAASPVYRLLGGSALPDTATWPSPGDSRLLMNHLGYHMHAGGHTVLPEDWELFIRYLKQYL